MMTSILTVFGLAWFIIGTVLTYGTLTKLVMAKPPRQALRRGWRDRFHTDAVVDFLHMGLKVLWVVKSSWSDGPTSCGGPCEVGRRQSGEGGTGCHEKPPPGDR